MALSKVTPSTLASMPMCPVAKRIPGPKGRGTVHQQTEESIRHASYVNAVNLLHHFPEERINAEKFIINSILEKARRAAMSEGSFEESWCVAKIDRSWMIGWISSMSALSAHTLERAAIYDAKSVMHIFCFMVGMLPTTKLPDECQRKQLFYFFASSCGRLVARP